MSYFDNPEYYTARGIDYDLAAALENNPQGEYTIEDIEKVFAVVEGENDARNWYWIFKLSREVNGNSFVYLTGGCDYTGWECRSSASSEYAPTAEDALAMVTAGEGEYNYDEVTEAHGELARQLTTLKATTWREANDKGVPAINLDDYLKDVLDT